VDPDGFEQLKDWSRRIAHEFAECPGLRLTSAQAARLWGLEESRAESLLSALVEARVLSRTGAGRFVSTRRCTTCA
jgi:hypothetical protein